jgi:MFS family permease
MPASKLPRSVFTYENGLLLLLGVSFGLAFFDRTSGGVLVPFIEKDLPFDNTKVAWIGGGLSLTWALGAYLIGRWSDTTGVRKPFLLAFLVIFSLSSIASGLAHSYPVLLASRMLMGAVEGPFLPVCLAIMLAESSPQRRGINAGIMQNFFASVIGQTLAPILLTPLAVALGWRSAFFIAGVPGLVCALLVWLFVREPTRGPTLSETPTTVSEPKLGLWDMLRERNILMCCLI